MFFRIYLVFTNEVAILVYQIKFNLIEHQRVSLSNHIRSVFASQTLKELFRASERKLGLTNMIVSSIMLCVTYSAIVLELCISYSPELFLVILIEAVFHLSEIDKCRHS